MTVQWVKLSMDLFNDQKVRLIGAMPESDALLLIWLRLIIEAGRCNAGGWVYLDENHPYSDEMLATVFQRPINTVRLALTTFADLGMIEQSEQGIYLVNWGRHQNLDALERIQQGNRDRQKRYYDAHRKPNVRLTFSHATDQRKNRLDTTPQTPQLAVGGEKKEVEERIDVDDDLSEQELAEAVLEVYRLTLGRPAEGSDRDQLLRLVARYTADWVLDAIDECAGVEIRNPIAYVATILRNRKSGDSVPSAPGHSQHGGYPVRKYIDD